jgi:hypothetical protein
MDLFCEYINDFIEEHVREMAEYYDFDGHWIVKKEVCIRVFYTFFKWCTNKRYITYKINLTAPAQQAKQERLNRVSDRE